MNDRDVERLLVEKERLILEQKEKHERLNQEKSRLEGELRELQDAIDRIVAQLRAVGREGVEFGDLRRTTPISPVWGLDRGIPLDRYYIHRFLDRHKSDIRGHVLEVKDSTYARAFGGDRVVRCDVLDVNPANPRATVVADLCRADAIACDTYDCFILTQTLGVIYDVAESLRHAVRILKPGGVLLCTLPATGRISYEEGLDGDYWRFTEASIRRLFADVLPAGSYEVTGYGNVLACTAFLYGLAPHELSETELDVVDPYFPVVYVVRAVKPPSGTMWRSASPKSTAAVSRAQVSTRQAAVLTYHRVGRNGHDPHKLSVPVDEFRRHLEHVRDAGYRVLPLHDLVAAARAGELDGRCVSLTFDDGYRDALTDVAPMLGEFGFPATFFIVGAALDPGHEFWWDVLERVFLSGLPLPERLSLDLPAGPLDLATADWTQQRAAHDRLADVLFNLDRDNRDAVLSVLKRWSGEPAGRTSRCTMDADEVVRLARIPGVSIGAHSQHHLRLPLLTTTERQSDMQTCKRRLEAATGQRVNAFSYPYGHLDAETIRCVRDAGFEVAVTTEQATVTDSVDPFRVPRYEVRAGSTTLPSLFGTGI